MQSICSLVDTIPDNELIGLSCGSELLLKRAQRYVHLSINSVVLNRDIKYDYNRLPLSHRKRIIVNSGGSSLTFQQPDSTVISEPSFKGRLSLSCETSSIMSSSSSAPADPQMPSQLRRSSLISGDYDSDHSDSIVNQKALHSKNSGTINVKNQSLCDSPSTYSLASPAFNFSNKTSTDLDGSDLFFSPKTPVQNKPKTPAASTAAEDMEHDDFYNDYFDIDDFNESDIPDYFEEPHNSSSVTATGKEGGPSKSSWDKKPTTPVPTPKTSKISSPGKSARHDIMYFNNEMFLVGNELFPNSQRNAFLNMS